MAMFRFTITVIAVIFFNSSNAFWRLPCRSRIGLYRIDPIMSPGKVSQHAHALHGAHNLQFRTTYEQLISSNCTSCAVLQDNSAYWTPSLMFIRPNGSTEVVPQVGGMLAYYFLFGENIQAFPEGFRMMAGDSRRRNFTLQVPDPPKSFWTVEDETPEALAQKALGFNCLNYQRSAEGALERHYLPNKTFLDANCADGVRLELMFPSCWDGKNIDSPDHKSHLAYPNLVMEGECPVGFQTKVPALFYETIWDTPAYRGVDGNFVISNGDPTGFGYHGDFMTGWNVGFLQQAVNTCTNLSGRIEDCPLFHIQSDEDAAKCFLKTPDELRDDNCAGPRRGLCGNVTIQAGPGYAN